MKITGIYAIVHRPSGRRYIGSSVNVRGRFHHHTWALKRSRHPNTALQTAWAADGREAFEFVLLERVNEVAMLVRREQAYLTQEAPNLYNDSLIAARPPIGLKRPPRTDEWKAKISAANKGRKKPPRPDEHRQNMGLARRGKPHPYTDEQRRKIVAANQRRAGTTHTPAAKEKMSAAKRGRKIGPWKADAPGHATLRVVALARTYSPETRAKMSLSAKRRWHRQVA